MTAPVDVLAVMDREIRSVAYDVKNEQAEPDYLDKLCEARDAVAELIAADKEYDFAKEYRIEADNRIVSGDKSDGAFIRQARARHAYDRAVDRRRAALARVGSP